MGIRRIIVVCTHSCAAGGSEQSNLGIEMLMIRVVAIVKCSVCFSWLEGTDGVFDVDGQGVGMPTYDGLTRLQKGNYIVKKTIKFYNYAHKKSRGKPIKYWAEGRELFFHTFLIAFLLSYGVWMSMCKQVDYAPN